MPLPRKILERIICKRLSLFLEHNELLTPQQHGFRKGKSTITSIAALLNSMYDNINNSKPTYLVYVDFKKAFDSVSHEILISKLSKFALPSKSVDWFKRYLLNRSQRVNLDGY